MNTQDRPGVIFDVDGVLVDSYNAHLESWLTTTREADVKFTVADFAATFGRTSRDIIRSYWPDGTRLGDQEITDIDAAKESLYRQLVSDDFPAMDGAVDLIDQLNDRGFALAAGSSGPPENVELALRMLDRRDSFDAVVTGMDVTRGKPDPQVFVLGAERLGLQPAQCVVIEDASAGVEAAHRAGMGAVGLVSTGRTMKELAAADLIVPSLRDLDSDRLRELLSRRSDPPGE